MSSQNIESIRSDYPGKSDTEATKAFAEEYGYIAIVRYKNSTTASDFTNIGTCKTEAEIRGYLTSPYCHAAEVIYDGRSTLFPLNADHVLKGHCEMCGKYSTSDTLQMGMGNDFYFCPKCGLLFCDSCYIRLPLTSSPGYGMCPKCKVQVKRAIPSFFVAVHASGGQLIESSRPTPVPVRTPEVPSPTLANAQTVEASCPNVNPTMSATSAPVVSMSQRSASGNAKGAVESIGGGLEIFRTMAELSPNVPNQEAAFFAGTMTAVVNLVYWYSVGDEEVRKDAWWTMTRAQSYCAEYVKTNWKQEERFRALEAERPHLIAGRSPDSNVFNFTATEILIAVLACLHTTFKRGSIGRSSYEPAIPCIQWLAEHPDPLVSAKARNILGKVEAAPEKKGGCFVATAAYGPQDCNVVLLQEYRDRIMIRSFLGRCAVRIYYSLSPPLARFIGVSSRRQSLAREFLRPFVACARRRLEQRHSRKPSANSRD